MLIAIDNGIRLHYGTDRNLANQHAKNISSLMKRLYELYREREVKVALLIGGQKKSERDKSLEEIELQEADIIVGTHACS